MLPHTIACIFDRNVYPVQPVYFLDPRICQLLPWNANFDPVSPDKEEEEDGGSGVVGIN